MLVEALVAELGHEVRTTRRHLERIPSERFDWRPHPRSFTIGMLGSHLVDCIRWGESIFPLDELEMDPATFRPYDAASRDDLLNEFDQVVERCRTALAALNDAALLEPWRLRFRGRVQVDKPRWIAFRDFTLSHLIHHRGQLTVYLRLLEVPVPGSYGPTADDR